MTRVECLMAFVTIIRKDPTIVLGLLSPIPSDKASAMIELSKHIAENTPPDDFERDRKERKDEE